LLSFLNWRVRVVVQDLELAIIKPVYALLAALICETPKN
jgi:hypothetical protein